VLLLLSLPPLLLLLLLLLLARAAAFKAPTSSGRWMFQTTGHGGIGDTDAIGGC
jgi:hypothetical protein